MCCGSFKCPKEPHQFWLFCERKSCKRWKIKEWKFSTLSHFCSIRFPKIASSHMCWAWSHARNKCHSFSMILFCSKHNPIKGHNICFFLRLDRVSRHPLRSLHKKCFIFGGAWSFQMSIQSPSHLRWVLSRMFSIILW